MEIKRLVTFFFNVVVYSRPSHSWDGFLFIANAAFKLSTFGLWRALINYCGPQ
jgi:hypothetical protein